APDQEAFGDARGVQGGGEGEAGHLERAAEPRQEGAKDEDAREEPPLIHAEGGDHLAILRRRADEDAPARTVEDDPESEGDERPEHDDGEVVGGEELARDGHGAAEAGSGWPRLVV